MRFICDIIMKVKNKVRNKSDLYWIYMMCYIENSINYFLEFLIVFEIDICII